jgi:acylglycerol lipase
MHGTDDKATVCHGSQFFYETGSKDKTLKLYEGHYHDLLNDIGKEQVMNDIRESGSARACRGHARHWPA